MMCDVKNDIEQSATKILANFIQFGPQYSFLHRRKEFELLLITKLQNIFCDCSEAALCLVAIAVCAVVDQPSFKNFLETTCKSRPQLITYLLFLLHERNYPYVQALVHVGSTSRDVLRQKRRELKNYLRNFNKGMIL